MKPTTIPYFLKKGLSASMLVGLMFAASSCNVIYEDLDPCPTGVRLRFIEEETLDQGNIFYSQGHCLTLYVYDSQGYYLLSRTATYEEISDEDWRMDIDLPAGQYKLLAYGGMDCEEASFSFTVNPTTVPMQDVEVRLDPRYASPDNTTPLHYLFYGMMNLEIPEAGNGTGPTVATLPMMKDTNDFRILLANENGLPTNAEDFEFNIITDNTLMNYENNLLSAGLTTYWPWTSGNAEVGLTEENEPATVAYAELSIPRLVYGNPTTLLIKRKSDGQEVVKLPLINILMLYKSDRHPYNTWTPQQFLDRESRWNMTFFLTADGRWVETKIVVNDWVVRINNITDL